jgi:hypothetical protein
MDKAQILRFYGLEEPTYQQICSIVGLENPETLSGGQFDEFDKVHAWLKTNEVRSFSEARERYRAEAKAVSAANNGLTGIESPELKNALVETAEVKAEITLESGLELLSHADQYVQRSLLKPYLEAVHKQAQSPEFQEKYRKACEDETVVDADYFYEDPDGDRGGIGGGYSGLASLAAIILHQQLMIFCHSHRAVLQTRADSLKIRERHLMQHLHHKEQTLKTRRRLTKNLFVVVGALSMAVVLGAVAGVNYPPAIACAKNDAICSLRFRAGVVRLK